MPREKREADARRVGGAKKRARTPAAGASSRRARDQEASERRLDNDDADCERILVPFVDAPAGGPGRHLLPLGPRFRVPMRGRVPRVARSRPRPGLRRRASPPRGRGARQRRHPRRGGRARRPSARDRTPRPTPRRRPRAMGNVRARELRLLLAAREMTNSTTTTTTTSSPRQLYADVCAFACYDCREMRDALDPAPRAPRTTAGTLRVRLCVTCSRGYSRWRPTGQRLVTATAAKERYGLRPADLARFQYGLDTNPVDPGFAPMKLYRRTDARAAAMARWGSGEALEAELRKRMLGDR